MWSLDLALLSPRLAASRLMMARAATVPTPTYLLPQPTPMDAPELRCGMATVSNITRRFRVFWARTACYLHAAALPDRRHSQGAGRAITNQTLGKTDCRVWWLRGNQR